MLRRNQRVILDGKPFRVAYVNPSRAHVVSTERKLVTVSSRGKVRTFWATSTEAIDISPNSIFDLEEQ